VFRFEVDHWVVGYNEHSIRLRDAKGLRCLAILLRAPGRSCAAPELLDIADAPGSPSNPYAFKPSSPEHGKPAAAERARVLVTKLIKGAIQRIAAHHPVLGPHLRRTISTGRQCVYIPDPDDPINWQL
jgi:hypothetical protein